MLWEVGRVTPQFHHDPRLGRLSKLGGSRSRYIRTPWYLNFDVETTYKGRTRATGVSMLNGGKGRVFGVGCRGTRVP